jgi:hypothetical protein
LNPVIVKRNAQTKLDTAIVSLEVKKPNQSIESNDAILFFIIIIIVFTKTFKNQFFSDKLKLASIIWLSWAETCQTTHHVKNTRRKRNDWNQKPQSIRRKIRHKASHKTHKASIQY